MKIQIATTGDERVLDAFYKPDARLGIVACSGGNRSAMTAGAYIALRRRRLRLKPVAFAGVSSGIPTTAYFMGDGVAPDTKVFSDDTSDSRLFKMARRFRGEYPFDVDYIDRVFRGTETSRGIKARNVINHPAPLYCVMGHSVTGEPLIFLPKTAEDVWNLSSYGTAITGFSKPLEFKGLPVTDGFFTSQLMPVAWLAKREQLTDVLVFACCHKDEHPKKTSWFEQSLYLSRFASTSKSVRKLIATRHIRFTEAARDAVEINGVRVLIVWIPEKIPSMGVSKEKARDLIHQGYFTMEQLFRSRQL